jgi:hypothetical protein
MNASFPAPKFDSEQAVYAFISAASIGIIGAAPKDAAEKFAVCADYVGEAMQGSGGELKRVAVDRLQDIAVGAGLAASYGDNWIQSVLTRAFAEDGARPLSTSAQAAIEYRRKRALSPPRAEREQADPDEAEPPGREASGGGKPVAIAASAFKWIDPAAIPRRQWLYGRHYVRKFISETVAPGAYGKSTLAMTEALAIVTGRPLLGVTPDERVNVWYWNGEDPEEELQRRIAAAALRYEIDPTELEGRLFVDTGRKTKIVIAEQTRAGAVIARPIVEAVIETIKANAIGLMTVDPVVASHRVVENDNPAIELVAATWAEIADLTGCAIELVHHARKTGGAEITVEDGRGGSALLAKVRSARTLNGMTDDEASRAGVENRRAYFRVQNGKANLSPAPDKADWYRLEYFDLDNGGDGRPGDSVGVMTRWTWPDAFDGVTVSDLRAVQVAIAADRWRESPQAKEWAGHAVAAVLKLDATSKAHKAKIVGLLKTWISTGMLRVVDGEDAKRMKRSFIEVGTPAND